jgi:hypothetical protein
MHLSDCQGNLVFHANFLATVRTTRVRVFDGPGYEPARAMPTEPSAATAEDVNASMVVHSDYLRRRP